MELPKSWSLLSNFVSAVLLALDAGRTAESEDL